MSTFNQPSKPVDIEQQTVDFHLDNILRAAGSGLKYYSMPKSLEDMRNAFRFAVASVSEQHIREVIAKVKAEEEAKNAESWAKIRGGVA